MTAPASPASVVGDAADVGRLLRPPGVLGPPGLLGVDSADGPGQQATPQAAVAARGDGQTTGQQIELAWAQAHPGGLASADGAVLLLWNFDVGSAVLKREHTVALASFLAPFIAAGPPTPAICRGSASAMGDRQANEELADRRAQAVADWCADQGLPGVSVGTGGVTAGHDGQSDAMARAVRLEMLKAQPEASQAPATKLLPGTDSMPPIVADCGVKNTIEIALPTPLPYYPLPANGWLVGTLSFSGSARFTYADPGYCLSVQERIDTVGSSWSVKATSLVTKGLSAGLNLSGGWNKDATASLVAVVGNGPWAWEISIPTVPSSSKWFTIKSPKFPLTELPPIGPDPEPMYLDGAEVTVQILGQIEFSGAPGPLLLEAIAEYGWEIALVTGGLATIASVFYVSIDVGGNSTAYGFEVAGLIAERMGYGAQIAVGITTGAGEEEARQFLAGYYQDRHLGQVLNIVTQARAQADADLGKLGDHRQATIAQLAAKYGQNESTGQPRAYRDIAADLFGALGGNSTRGERPSLGLLTQ